MESSLENALPCVEKLTIYQSWTKKGGGGRGGGGGGGVGVNGCSELNSYNSHLAEVEWDALTQSFRKWGSFHRKCLWESALGP
jgi:hypothetical protein